MPRKSTIVTYVVLLLFEALLLGLLLSAGGSRCRMYSRFVVVHTADGAHIIPDDFEDAHEQEVQKWIDSPEFIDMSVVSARPVHALGPLPGVFEYYRSYRCLSSINDVRGYISVSLSERELETIYRGVIAEAKQDPWLSQYAPGSPPHIQFAPDLLIWSLVRPPLLFGIPALLMRIGHLVGCWLTPSKSLQLGQCACCGYDCRELPSPICPECGLAHGVQIPLAEEQAASTTV